MVPRFVIVLQSDDSLGFFLLMILEKGRGGEPTSPYTNKVNCSEFKNTKEKKIPTMQFISNDHINL